jgi:hypothetical protein
MYGSHVPNVNFSRSELRLSGPRLGITTIDERRFSRYNTSSIQEDAEQALSGRAGGALEEK